MPRQKLTIIHLARRDKGVNTRTTARDLADQLESYVSLLRQPDLDFVPRAHFRGDENDENPTRLQVLIFVAGNKRSASASFVIERRMVSEGNLRGD